MCQFSTRTAMHILYCDRWCCATLPCIRRTDLGTWHPACMSESVCMMGVRVPHACAVVRRYAGRATTDGVCLLGSDSFDGCAGTKEAG